MDDAIKISLKETGKILLSFLPLFAFWFISMGHTLIRLQVGIYTGIAILIVLVITRLARGMLVMAMAIYFAVALVGVLFKNIWIIHYLGVLPGAILFVISMLSLILGKPFVQDYAREGVPPEQQESVQFVRVCFIMTSFWAIIFLAMSLLNVIKLNYPDRGELFYTIAQLAILVLGMAYTTTYMVHVKRKRLAMSKINGAKY
jgi:hypothetical protein